MEVGLEGGREGGAPGAGWVLLRWIALGRLVDWVGLGCASGGFWLICKLLPWQYIAPVCMSVFPRRLEPSVRMRCLWIGAESINPTIVEK